MAVARNMEATLGVPVFRVARRINTDRSVPRARAARAHTVRPQAARGACATRMCDARTARARCARMARVMRVLCT